ncbi:MAG: glycosyltransferase family 2 protein [Cyanobacteria bacterium J06632_3]
MTDFVEPVQSELELDLDVETESLFDPELFEGYNGRRLKAAIALCLLWLLTGFLHLISWGHSLVLVVTSLMAIHALRVILSKPLLPPQALPSVKGNSSDRSATLEADKADAWPYISLLVAAKNEEQVIGRLVESLLTLDYPSHRYDLWVIDDYSTDATPQILDNLARKHPTLNVIHRGPNATGGKSGALNLVWPKTKGDLLAVFDADAHVPTDLLRHVVPMFDATQGVAKTGAIQVRKAIANVSTNLWTRGQKAEMALDCYIQQRRIAIGGIGELRGNGQFVRRRAIAQCGGWNEETITDDLDLTIQLHLHGWNIDLLFQPAVEEEGVTNALALWHQRNRWAEGGFQRYLDYWRLLAKNQLGWGKTIDMAGFWMIQYMLPVVAFPDFVLSLFRHQLPVFGPMTAMAVAMSGIGMFTTLREAEAKTSVWSAIGQTVLGSIYMLHWLVVIGTMAMRISIRPKQLKWVKTVHSADM